MFTGIVDEVGTVDAAIERGDAGARLRDRARARGRAARGRLGRGRGRLPDRDAVGAGGFEADVMNQTLALTTLGELDRRRPGQPRAGAARGDPLGGHIVQGHVDGVGEVRAVTRGRLRATAAGRLPDGLDRYVVEHGSVALDGVSLTVAALAADGSRSR